jgi:hypothetical protein
MTEPTKVDIFKTYPGDKFIPLIPVRTYSQISPLHKMAVNFVQISPDEGEKDVYKQGDGLALTKKGLMKLMAAANIQIVEIRKVAPSSCEKCLEMARATGKPSACAQCPNKNDVAYEATLSIPDPAGGFRLVKGSREFICEDEKARMTEPQYKQAFGFRGAMTESKAINRAIRAALMVKSSYRAAELQKTFVVPIVVPDASDPEMKAAMLERYRKGTEALYGGAAPNQQALSAPESLESIDGSDDELDSAIEAEFSAGGEEPSPAASLPQPGGPVANPPFCAECGKVIIAFKTKSGTEWSAENWSKFAKDRYGEPVCPQCAQAREAAARETEAAS